MSQQDGVRFFEHAVEPTVAMVCSDTSSLAALKPNIKINDKYLFILKFSIILKFNHDSFYYKLHVFIYVSKIYYNNNWLAIKVNVKNNTKK